MTSGKITKNEWLLLGLTAVFLCAMLALFTHDRAALTAVPVETEMYAAPEEVLPEWKPLDLNTASQEDLQTLPGIGEELARRIVAYRTENGPFETAEDLMKVSGIGEGKFAALQEQVTVGSEDAS